MKKMIAIFFLVVCCVGGSFAQQKVPDELIKAMKNYLKDEISVKGTLRTFELDTTIQVSKIEFGVPVELFLIDSDREGKFIDSLDEFVSVRSIIKSTGLWRFYLNARGKSIYHVEFQEKNGIFRWCGSGNAEGLQSAWFEMRAEYPESSGVNPIILNFGMEEFVHFPQVSDHNLTRLMAKEYRNDNVKKYNSLKEFQ